MALSHKEAAKVLLFQRRVLIGVTAFSTLGIIIWIVAVCTDYWFIVDVPQGALNNRTGALFLRSNAGLWRICTTTLTNFSSSSGNGPDHSLIQSALITRECKAHPLFPPKRSISRNPEIDETILDYNRTEALFAVVSLLLMILGIGFSIYTFKETRYMYKRLAGAILFLAASAVIVVIEVSTKSIEYEREHMPTLHPKNAVWYYGYSYMLAWTVFLIYISSAVGFIACSRKRKSDRSPWTEDWGMDDEPHIIGR